MKLLDWIKSHKLCSVLIAIIMLLGVPGLIHILFKIPACCSFLEAKWTAGDALGYYGSLLSLLGSATVSLIAVFLSQHFSKENSGQERSRRDHEKNMQLMREIHEREMQQQKLEKQRRVQIQPILSVEIVDIDSQIKGTAEPIRGYKHPTIEHKNFELSIENAGNYPITHIFVFEKYLFSILKSNKSKEIQCAYSDSIDAEKWGEKLDVVLLESEQERNERGLPIWLNICYDDIDGNSMFQTFVLKESDGKFYYALEGIYDGSRGSAYKGS